MYYNEKHIEDGKGTIYHELGHVFGYCLSNKSSKTSLGEIEKIEIGVLNNCVSPKKTFYHISDLLVEREIILKNTSFINRTFAWFIEVISGCTFQILFEKNKSLI